MPIRTMLVLLFATVGLTLGPVAEAEPLIIELTVASDINPATASYISRGIDAARRRDAAMVLIKLDTPGGQMISMRQ
ncbi:MAG: nodulation protein NfeD, partial [Anaerolineae bacterium]|nr:nodulation protein NfeD [Anaerolineae bacterium]